MDCEFVPEMDMTPAFDKIGRVSSKQSTTDFGNWRQTDKGAPRLCKLKAARKPRGHISIMHEDDNIPYVALRRARSPSASKNELEGLYGPQQVIIDAFCKRQVTTQEQFLVRWAPTFMLRHHIESYHNIRYKTDTILKVQGLLNHAVPCLCLVSWQDAWEPAKTVRSASHLDGCVLRIDEDAKNLLQ